MIDGFTRRATLTGATSVYCAAAASSATASIFARPPEAEGYAQVPGGKVYWRRFGSGSKTPLLTLHGGPGAAHNYLLPLKALADERPVIFYDQLGCAKSDSPSDEKLYTVQRSVEELDAVREALGLEKVALYGHSWGALLAGEYLCQGRGKGIDTIILGGAMASIPQVVAGMQRLIDHMPDGFAEKLHGLEKAGKMQTPEYAALVEQFYGKHLLRVPPSPDAAASFEALASSIAYRVMNGPNEFFITGVIKDWDRSKDLKAITQRTLLLTGEFDEITLDCHETIRRGISGPARLEVLKGCSHLAMNEQPETYVALLRKFLASA